MRKRQTMEIIETFGHYVENLTDKKPQSARRLLKTGWEAQNLKFRYMQDKRLMPADRHLANLMMDTMLRPIQKPEDSVIVSIFTPCEMMQEVGLHPYNVEGFSCYLSASKAERAFLQQAENQGIAETLCSYHKTFLGAAQKGLLPKPKCIVYTNLTCDANLLTFRTLADFYQVPVFAIDVPWNQTTENVQYVADQLKDLKIFLEKNTGKTISEDRLKERLACSKRTLENYKKYQQMRADRYVPSDLVTPLYAGMTNNILLGTAEEEKYTQMLLEDIKKAPAAKGKHIYWMHTIPFWSDAVRQELCFSEKAQIVGCELAETCEPDFDPENPFEAMAERMVYHSLNGSALRRIEAGIRHAKQAGADGAVWFGHWGCKHTLGAAQLAKKKIEEAETMVAVEDLYLPFRPKRKTRASMAKERGLEPLADTILLQVTKEPMETLAAQYVSEEKGVADAKAAIDGAKDILAERISEVAKYRAYIRNVTKEEGSIVSAAKDEKTESVYEMYYHHEELVRKCAGHRILALNRGEKEKILTVKIAAPEEKILRYLNKMVITRENPVTTPAR